MLQHHFHQRILASRWISGLTPVRYYAKSKVPRPTSPEAPLSPVLSSALYLRCHNWWDLGDLPVCVNMLEPTHVSHWKDSSSKYVSHDFPKAYGEFSRPWMQVDIVPKSIKWQKNELMWQVVLHSNKPFKLSWWRRYAPEGFPGVLIGLTWSAKAHTMLIQGGPTSRSW